MRVPEPYDKPFLTLNEQVAHLRGRGMLINDEEQAVSLLRNIGYYRLSGYSYMFRQPDDSEGAEPGARKPDFTPGTSIEQVHKVYQFDRGLRQRVFDALERVEVALRFSIGHVLGQSHAFAHRDPRTLHSSFTSLGESDTNLTYSGWLDSKHADWLKEVDREERRSREAFVLHFNKKHGRPLPVWVVTEILSFGTLGRLYGGLDQAHRERIAEDFLVLNAVPSGDSVTFSNWLNHLRYIRNVCAHHARLWNRTISIKLNSPTGIPDLQHLVDSEGRAKVYGTLAVLAFLLEKMEPGNSWRMDLLSYIDHGLASIGQSHTSMGFPENWHSLAIWQETFKPTGDLVRQRKIIQDSFESRPTGETAFLLRPSEQDSKKRRNWVRWLRSKHQLLGLKLVTTNEYPSFQIDADRNEVFPIAVAANERAFAAIRRPRSHESDIAWLDEASWEVARWWMTPLPDHEDMTPKQLLEAGRLDIKILDRIFEDQAEA